VLGLLTQLAAANPPAGPFLIGMVLGFLVGTFGHILHSRPLILLGLALLGVTVSIFMVDGLRTG
jgi:F0F1-type ATP synthase assembly protein I